VRHFLMRAGCVSGSYVCNVGAPSPPNVSPAACVQEAKRRAAQAREAQEDAHEQQLQRFFEQEKQLLA
jgi:hypothetical protein